MVNTHSPPGPNSNESVVVVNPSGPHHRARCSASEKDSNTKRRGASISRSMTISRSRAVLGRSMFPFLSFQFLCVCLETVERSLPEALEAADPLVDPTQAASVEAIEAVPSSCFYVHQADFPQDPEVLGRRRLGETEPLRDGADGLLVLLQQREDPPS